MARIWLHIGTMKTGTTAMQEWCAAHEDALLAQGLLYIRARRRAASGHLIKALSKPDPDASIMLKQLREQIAASTAEDVLISAESLSARGPEFCRPLVTALAGHDLHILIWLRRQDRYAEALYKQNVKWRGRSQSIESFLRGMVSQLDYADLLTRWQAAFPDAHLMPQIYDEPEAGAAPDSIAAMMQAIGRPDLIPHDSATFRRNHTPNAGLIARYREISGEQAQVLRRINRQVMREFAQDAAGRGDLITPERAAEIRAQHAGSNRAVCQRWFPERISLFADAADAPASPVAGDMALRRFDDLLAAHSQIKE